MVVPHLDFHKFTESARSPCLTELTQNQWIASSKLSKEGSSNENSLPVRGGL